MSFRIAVFGLLALAACGDSSEEPTTALPANAGDAVATYARIVSASYEDSASLTRALDTAVASFVAAPDDDTLAAARSAWLASREPYLQTEVYRFYDGPIDN